MAADRGAIIVITTRPDARNADDLAPLGFRFFAAMPLTREAVIDVLGSASVMAEYIKTPLGLSLAHHVLAKLGCGDAEPANRPALYSQALDAILDDASDPLARGIGAGARLQRVALGTESLRLLLRRLALNAQEAHATTISMDDIKQVLGGDMYKTAAMWRLGRNSFLPPLAPRGDALTFSHLSFQEHLAAEESGVVALFADFNKLSEPWWGDTLFQAWSLANVAKRDEAIAALDSSRRWLQEKELVEVANEDGEFDGAKWSVVRDDGATVTVVRNDNCGSGSGSYSADGDIGGSGQRSMMKQLSNASMRQLSKTKSSMVALAGGSGSGQRVEDANDKIDDAPNTEQSVSRWRVRREVTGAASFARYAAGSPEYDSALLLKAVAPIVDLVTAVSPSSKDSALHFAARAGAVLAWKFLIELAGAKGKADNAGFKNPRDLAAAWTVPAAGRMGINRQYAPPDCDLELQLAEEHRSKEPSDRENDAMEFMCAAKKGALEPAKRLLVAGLAVDTVVPLGSCTAIHFAAVEGNMSMVQLLLDHNASIEVASKAMHQTPIWLAAKFGNANALSVMLTHRGRTTGDGGEEVKGWAHVEHLVEHSADEPSVLSSPKGASRSLPLGSLQRSKSCRTSLNDLSWGMSPLYVACWNGHLEAVRVLLEHNANCRTAMKDGGAPLLAASQNGSCDIVRLLLDHSADIGQALTDGSTSLFLASQNGHLDVVRILLERNADVDQANTDGISPLSVAQQNNHDDVARLLLDRGAKDNKPLTPRRAAHRVYVTGPMERVLPSAPCGK